jgi:hypothetical protein
MIIQRAKFKKTLGDALNDKRLSDTYLPKLDTVDKFVGRH